MTLLNNNHHLAGLTNKIDTESDYLIGFTPIESSGENLWEIPEPLPPNIMDEIPGEEAVQVVFENYYPVPDQRPLNWSVQGARRIVNFRRQEKYFLYQKGYYQKFPPQPQS